MSNPSLFCMPLSASSCGRSRAAATCRRAERVSAVGAGNATHCFSPQLSQLELPPTAPSLQSHSTYTRTACLHPQHGHTTILNRDVRTLWFQPLLSPIRYRRQSLCQRDVGDATRRGPDRCAHPGCISPRFSPVDARLPPSGFKILHVELCGATRLKAKPTTQRNASCGRSVHPTCHYTNVARRNAGG